jgi:site-specific recombinase XerD
VIGIGPTEANLDLVEGFNQWLTVQNYSASTRINYCTDVRGLACFAARSSLLEIERRQVVEYMRFLKEFRNLAAASIARTIFSLRKFYKFLTLGEIVHRVPMLTISSPKVPTRLAQALSKDQIEKLLVAARTPRDLAVLELFYGSGIRRAELQALDCEDVHFDADGKGGSAFVRHGKGDKQRVTIFGRFAADALRAYLKGRTTGPLILVDRHSHKGSGIPRNISLRLGIRTIERIVKKVARRAGLGDIRPHQLRHSFATHLLDGGTNIVYIAELLGHTSISATQRYLHVATAELIRVHNKFHPNKDTDDKTKTYN